ncbi:putative NADPH quinone oxidoreductase [Thiomonas sp. X19]|nr:putative NADPH quinone oxidoreductase [Thiomonas sp. X19]
MCAASQPMMRAVEISQPGGPEVLRIAQRPRPVPGPGALLIEVAAAGVNRPDVMQRKGIYPPPPGASDIPGLEVAGRIVAQGEGAHHPAVGEQACALVTGGGYAEYCVAPAELCLPIPDGLNAVEAASLPEPCLTVWSNVFERAHLQKGETLLVHGGSGGIGATAIQMAKALGSHVLVTAGSAEKCAFCQRLGAEHAIDYALEDFVAAVRQIIGGKGVDVILDMVGGDYLQRNATALADDGRLVSINTMMGGQVQISLRDVMVKRLTMTGSTLRSRPLAVKAAMASALHKSVWPLFASGRMKPVVYRTYYRRRLPRTHTDKAVRTLEKSS